MGLHGSEDGDRAEAARIALELERERRQAERVNAALIERVYLETLREMGGHAGPTKLHTLVHERVLSHPDRQREGVRISRDAVRAMTWRLSKLGRIKLEPDMKVRLLR